MKRSQLDEIIRVVGSTLGASGDTDVASIGGSENASMGSSSSTPPSIYECIEAEWLAGSRTLRIFIDRIRDDSARVVGGASSDLSSDSESGIVTDALSGIDLEGCVQVTRVLNESTQLDELISGPYTLEVSSPGVERPLRRAGCFRQHIGETIDVRLARSADVKRFKGAGRLLSVEGDDEENPQLAIDMNTAEPWVFGLNQLERATLVHDWSQQ